MNKGVIESVNRWAGSGAGEMETLPVSGLPRGCFPGPQGHLVQQQEDGHDDEEDDEQGLDHDDAIFQRVPPLQLRQGAEPWGEAGRGRGR